jgi:hypothetical protein
MTATGSSDDDAPYRVAVSGSGRASVEDGTAADVPWLARARKRTGRAIHVKRIRIDHK